LKRHFEKYWGVKDSIRGILVTFFHSKKSLALLAILWVVSLTASLLLWLQGNGHIYWFNQQYPVAVQAAQLSGHGPFSYSVSMGTDRLSQTETFASPAVLFEDGRALGPGNALHADIGSRGGGRFSFWKGSLLFSTSDNTDPRVNGRRYILKVPFIPSSIWLIFTYLLTGLVTLLTVARLRLVLSILRFNSQQTLALFVILWVISLAVSLVLWLQGNGQISWLYQQYPVAVQAAQLSSHGPYSYTVIMGTDRLSQTDGFVSPAMLLEDGRILGPGNTLHSDIGSRGGGRFSFWEGSLLFSSSDNTDPRMNGRKYVLMLPFSLSPVGLGIVFSWVGLLSLSLLVTIWYTLPHIRRKLVIIVWGIGLVSSVGMLFRLAYPYLRTQIYVITFDPARYEIRGSDYCSPRFNPERIGKKREQIDSKKDYDFPRLAQTRAYLWGIDRKTALKYIFDKVTSGAQTDKEKHLAVLRFLQRVSYHNIFFPRYPSGEGVFDPLVILELGEMWCDDVASLAIDLFSAAGYKARMVQLSDHQIAEINYDNSWHYFDGDVFSGGDVIMLPDGIIPSVDELSRNFSSRLDSMQMYSEGLIINSCFGIDSGSGSYKSSYAYFSSLAYDISGTDSVFYIKTATLEEERQDTDNYGWLKYKTIPDTGRILSPLHLHYAPSIPHIDAIIADLNTRLVHLSFYSQDKDNDIYGYRIYISKERRGWDYATFYGSREIEKYWSNPNGWKPEMYDAYHRLPPAEIAQFTVSLGEVDIHIPEGETYYVSIMAFDAYGEQVGRKLYPVSNEIKLNFENKVY
jgi:hypothetical protein